MSHRRRVGARRTAENALHRFGFVHVAGADEVGRGCLAGPVVAGAVILDPARPVRRLADSKLLSPGRREDLAEEIRARAIAWAVGEVDAAEIDRINIHRASLEAMRRAVEALVPLPGALLVDAFRVPGLPVPQRGIIRGDRSCAALAAASIIAKVHRDALMVALHEADARYGYDRHKGYATAEHLAALGRFGFSSAHRRTFRQPSLFDTMAQDAPESSG